MKKLLLCLAGMYCVVTTTPAFANDASARAICKQFIELRGYKVTDWGEYWKWTTIKNADGSYSVGARVVGYPPGGAQVQMYLSCVAKPNGGDQWQLESLSRLQ